MKKKLVLATSLCLVLALLVACGGKPSMKSYIDDNIKSELEDLNSQNAGMMNIQSEVDGDDWQLSVTYDTLEASQVADTSAISSYVSSMSSTFTPYLNMLKEETSAKEPKITFIFLDKNGTEITRETIE